MTQMIEIVQSHERDSLVSQFQHVFQVVDKTKDPVQLLKPVLRYNAIDIVLSESYISVVALQQMEFVCLESQFPGYPKYAEYKDLELEVDNQEKQSEAVEEKHQAVFVYFLILKINKIIYYNGSIKNDDCNDFNKNESLYTS